MGERHPAGCERRRVFPKAQYRDWVFKLSGSYDLPFATQVAAMFTSQSGAVRTREVRFTGGLRQQTQLIPPMEPADARRLPTQKLLNVRLEKRQRIKFGQAAFQVEVFTPRTPMRRLVRRRVRARGLDA